MFTQKRFSNRMIYKSNLLRVHGVPKQVYLTQTYVWIYLTILPI